MFTPHTNMKVYYIDLSAFIPVIKDRSDPSGDNSLYCRPASNTLDLTQAECAAQCAQESFSGSGCDRFTYWSDLSAHCIGATTTGACLIYKTGYGNDGNRMDGKYTASYSNRIGEALQILKIP